MFVFHLQRPFQNRVCRCISSPLEQMMDKATPYLAAKVILTLPERKERLQRQRERQSLISICLEQGAKPCYERHVRTPGVIRLVNWVKPRPILRYHVGNRRETWESSMMCAGVCHEIRPLMPNRCTFNANQLEELSESSTRRERSPSNTGEVFLLAQSLLTSHRFWVCPI